MLTSRAKESSRFRRPGAGKSPLPGREIACPGLEIGYDMAKRGMMIMRTIRLVSLLAALAVLAGCVTAAQRRQNYVDANPDLAPEIAAAILEGKVVEGMTAEDVRASWGDPLRETVSISEQAREETWSYRTPIGQFEEGKVILNFINGKLVRLIHS